jgi:hypothetical protein
MFYEVEISEPEAGRKQISAMVVLNPADSRRLLAKATVALPEVQNAWKNGMIIIARGITNAYVTEELFGITVEPKAGQTVGREKWWKALIPMLRYSTSAPKMSSSREPMP